MTTTASPATNAVAPPRPASITDAFLQQLVARVPSANGASWKLTEVYTGEVLVDLPQSTPEDIEQAYAAARKAQREWAARPLKERLAVFKRAHALFIANAHTTADLIQVESGKNRRMAIEETCDPVMVMSHYLKRAPKLLKETKRGGPVPFVSNSTEIRRPKGIIGIIAPWNFPFATGISDSISALMAGNGIVLKPDNKTALSPLYGIQMLEEAGLPKGLFQVVCGEGPDVGPTLIDNANYVMFTGSTATGRVIGERAGANLIGACLELGGKNPMIVLEDADKDEVVQGLMFGAFGNTGQICMHIERVYLPASQYDDYKARLVAATEALRIGATYDFSIDVGSLVAPEHMDRVRSHVEDAVAKGATVLTGGKARPDLGPAFFEPTILEGVTKDMLAGVTETFGPVVALHSYNTVEEALELANDTEYGLNASVWGGDLKQACQVGRRIDSGNVNVNDILATAFASKGTPSGGVKQSGVGARHGDQGLLKYTDIQNLAVLKKQVMSPRPNQPYEDYVKGMLSGLTMMRKTRIR
jgi:succinate-semialdehyde dehydrogenase/glutarate-semialdehyde dehydrogenase